MKKGPNTGSHFLGCEDYPKCRFSKDIPQHSPNEPSFLFLKIIIGLIVVFTIYNIIE